MILQNLLDFFEQWAPSALQEGYDNSGLQIGNPLGVVSKGLICLDITPEVVSEAIQKGCDLIISHHPLIFQGLKRITGQTLSESIVLEVIRNNISVVSVHTNLDKVKTGVNQALGARLGLKKLRILEPQKGALTKLVTFCPSTHAEKVRTSIFEAGAGQIGDYDSCSFNIEGTGTFRANSEANPFVGKKEVLHFEPEVRIEAIVPAWLLGRVVSAMKASHPYEEVAYDIYNLANEYPEVGFGMIGEYDAALEEQEFMEMIKKQLRVPCLRHSGFTGQLVKNVALCGGSGSFLLHKAIASKAQVLVTAEIKYHQFFEANRKILLVDAGHFETEQFAVDILYDVVNKKFSNFALLKSGVNTNPVCYF